MHDPINIKFLQICMAIWPRKELSYFKKSSFCVFCQFNSLDIMAYLLLTKQQFASEGGNTRDIKLILDGGRGIYIFKLITSSRVTIRRTWA